MKTISDLAIAVTPFHLTIEITDKVTVPSIRGTEIVLPQIEIPAQAPHDDVKFRDVMEYVCREIGRNGLQLSFFIERDTESDGELDANRNPKPPKLHLKTFELTKRSGQRLAGGQTSLSHAEGSEVWHWTAHKSGAGSGFTSLDMVSGHGNAFHRLDEIDVLELRNVVFNFGVAPAS